jgi:N-acetylneuraminic acid mutarotase
MPGARAYAVSWIDKDENLWLFGGYGYSVSDEPGFLNDLWKFDTTKNEWTWMGGSNSINRVGNYGNGTPSVNNFPGGKRSACGWADKSGNFWLFGGRQESTSVSFLYNDLWKYNIGTNQWTWVSGSNLPNQNGNYGRMGVTLRQNIPGSRESGACWFDKDENLWLFGGYGKNSLSSGYLNDLWKFTTK